jgi:hypothetical protein
LNKDVPSGFFEDMQVDKPEVKPNDGLTQALDNLKSSKSNKSSDEEADAANPHLFVEQDDDVADALGTPSSHKSSSSHEKSSSSNNEEGSSSSDNNSADKYSDKKPSQVVD